MAHSKPCTAASPNTLTPDRPIAEIARVAFAGVRRLFNTDGSPKPVSELDDDTAAAVSCDDELVAQLLERAFEPPAAVATLYVPQRKENRHVA